MHYIWKEWKENIKGKGLWLSFSLIFLVSISLLFKTSILSTNHGFYVLLINLFDALVYFIPMICLFLGAFSIFQEKEQKTLIMLLTRRDHFMSFFFKKSAAVQSVLLGLIISVFFIYLVPLKFFFELDLIGYFSFILSLICLIIVFTQNGILIGSICRSKMQIVGFAIAIWFYFFFLHDFILLSFLSKVTYENVELFSSLYFLNPFQASRMFLESSLGIYSFDHMSKLLQSFMWMKPELFLLANITVFLLITTIIVFFYHRKEVSE